MEVKLLDADGKALLNVSSALQLPADAPLQMEFQHIAEINGLRFEAYGDYSFYILVNGETKAHVMFEVARTPTGSIGATPARPSPEVEH